MSYWPHSNPYDTTPETPCVICAHRNARNRSLMCGACFNKLRADISTLVGAYVWLGIAMLATGTRPTEPAVGHTAESRIPFRVDLHDKREEIAGSLAYWARMIAEAHVPALAGPADGDVETIGRWLRARLPWVSEQEGCVTMATELGASARSAYALVPWNARRRDLPLPCPDCTYLTLSLYGADEVITCRNRDCGRILSWADYWTEVRKQHADLSKPLDPRAFQGAA
jgi:hypothetical protein